MRLAERECRERFASARRAFLATADLGAVPHIVPVTFALSDDIVVLAVDHKPKMTSDLKRLRNIRANPRVALLVDSYDEDWARLWWVRADGTAEILDDPPAVDLLRQRYAAYADNPPQGPVIRVRVTRWSGWTSATLQA
ncbi:MAG: TIGR03668 family PPOX class F420-dependent oxidoreductase [Actinomycetota bacterium]|nr:TIGR03668 family PPOX class F420-dependent oxidoreductase [Actinomycetota bacterium]